MEKEKGEWKELHFTIEAEFIVNISRQLWADEHNPEKAVRILKAAFPEMADVNIFAILTGSETLIGDSNEGVEIVDDNETLSPCGNLLAMEAVFSKFRRDVDEVRNQLEYSTGLTEFVASPKGLVEVPRRCTEQNPINRTYGLKKGIELEDIPHTKVTRVCLEKAFKDPYRSLQRESWIGAELDKLYEKEEQDYWGKQPPPDPENKITEPNGWLAPNGKFYPCGYGEHQSMANRIARMPTGELSLEKKGWVKVQENKLFWDFLGRFKPTQRQIDTVFDWCQQRGVPMDQHFIEAGED